MQNQSNCEITFDTRIENRSKIVHFSKRKCTIRSKNNVDTNIVVGSV